MNKSNLYKENCYDNVTKSTIQCKQIKSDIYKYSLSSLSSKKLYSPSSQHFIESLNCRSE